MQTQRYWQAHLQAIESEGISTAAYARREGLVAQHLYAWRNRLKDQGTSLSTPHGAQSRSHHSRFVALQVDTFESNEAACTLRLGRGIELQMDSLPNAQWLASVIAATQQVA